LAQAALLLPVSFAIWAALFVRAWTPQAAAMAALAAFAATAFAWRFNATDALVAQARQMAPLFSWRGAGAVFTGLARVAGLAFSPRLILKPALLRVVADPSDSAPEFAAEIALLRAAGAVLVDIDARGVLLHVLDEDDATPVSGGLA